MLVWYVCDPEDFVKGFFFFILMISGTFIGLIILINIHFLVYVHYIYVLKIQMFKVNEQITIRFSID